MKILIGNGLRMTTALARYDDGEGMRNGMTLMSVMVAVALAGIVAVAVARLLGSQSQTMAAVRLREQREELLKHYKSIVIAGWDATRSGTCPHIVCSRAGLAVIPTANGNALLLADDLYDYGYTGSPTGRWWRVTALRRNLPSGEILQADSYVEEEGLIAVEVRVEFIPAQHPTVKIRLAEREEIVFLHHNTPGAISDNTTDCTNPTLPSNPHLTQLDSAGVKLYEGAGAIIQYDFNSNYAKCSQVPLVTAKDCAKGALLGFSLDATDTFVTGDPICSTDLTPTEKRTVKAIDCSQSGYVEQIVADEETRCVGTDGTPATGRARRVAAQQGSGTALAQTYTLLRLASPGGRYIDRSYPGATTALPDPPTWWSPDEPDLVEYDTFSCEIERFPTISDFRAGGGHFKSGVREGLLPPGSDGTQRGPPGPRGDRGRGLVRVRGRLVLDPDLAPPGPQGEPADCFLCCKKKYPCEAETHPHSSNCVDDDGDSTTPDTDCYGHYVDDSVDAESSCINNEPSPSWGCQHDRGFRQPDNTSVDVNLSGCYWSAGQCNCEVRVTFNPNSP